MTGRNCYLLNRRWPQRTDPRWIESPLFINRLSQRIQPKKSQFSKDKTPEKLQAISLFIESFVRTWQGKCEKTKFIHSLFFKKMNQTLRELIILI